MDIVQDVDPVEVKTVTIKNPLFANHCNYFVYFNHADNVNLDILKTIKSIFRTTEGWDSNKTNRSVPSQFRRCFRFSHAEEKFRMDIRCGICAESHQIYQSGH